MPMTRSRNRGVALIVALVVLLLLSSLAAAILFVVQTQAWSSNNFRLSAKGRFLADMAVQASMNWFSNSYAGVASFSPAYATSPNGVEWKGAPVVLSGIDGQASNFPSSAEAASFSAALQDKSVAIAGLVGSYSASATLLSWQAMTIPFSLQPSQLETWQITAQGKIVGPGGGGLVQEVAIFTQEKQPLMNYAVFATNSECGAINLAGGADTDSFDSSKGTYDQTESLSNGDVGTNGNVLLGDHTVVNGTASVDNPVTGLCPGAGVTLGPNAQVTGQEVGGFQGPLLSLADVPPMPSIAPVTPGSGQMQVNKSTTISPGAYGDISLQGGGTLVFQPGSYSINSLSVQGTGTITISPAGQVILYVAGNNTSTPVSLTGNSLTNNTGVPANFQIVYGGTSTISIAGGASAYSVVYAPNAPVVMTGGSDWYGSIISNTFNEQGNKTSLHYDRSLAKQYLIPGLFQLVSVSRSKF